MKPTVGASDRAGSCQANKYGTQLSRTLKPSWTWAIALGSAVGWGAFVLPTDWLATAGPLGAVLGFLIGGALMLVIAVSFGHMVRIFPVSGGAFVYALLEFGRRHAFVCGWFLTLAYICIVALNASALAMLARFLLPQVAEQGLLYEVAGWEVYLGEILIASAALVIFAVLNVRGASLSGRLQYIFCLIMVAGVALVALSVALHPDSGWDNLRPAFALDTPPWAAVLAIVAIAPWALAGFDIIPQVAEEFDFPPTKAFRLIVLAITAAVALYAVMIIATAGPMPWTTLTAEQPVWGTGHAISELFGGLGVLMLTVPLLMGIATGLNGFYVAASRLLLAMGRARIIPQTFASVHPRHKTPHIGIVFSAGVCLIAPWFGREVLLWVVDMSAVGFATGFAFACLAAHKRLRSLRARKNGESAMSARRLISLSGAIISLTFVALLLVPGSPAALGKESLIALLIWTALGGLFYIVRLRGHDNSPAEELSGLHSESPTG